MKQSTAPLSVILNLFGEGAEESKERGRASGEKTEKARDDAGAGRTGETASAKGGTRTQQNDAGSAQTEEALRSEFLKLVNGKFKDVYTAETQKIIDRRFREAKRAEAELREIKPLAELLFRRYGIQDRNLSRLMQAVADDDPTLAQRAEKNGMPLEQQRTMDRFERENRLLRAREEQRLREERARAVMDRWMREAELLRKDYPDFELQAELKNPEFVRLLRAEVPLRYAYEVIHRDALMQDIANRAKASAEKRVVDDIRAQGLRPRENGASSQGTFVTRMDPSAFTREDRAKIRERALAGERIVF